MGVQIQTLQTKVKMNFIYFTFVILIVVTVKSVSNPSAKANPKADPKADPKANAKAWLGLPFMPQYPNQYPNQYPYQYPYQCPKYDKYQHHLNMKKFNKDYRYNPCGGDGWWRGNGDVPCSFCAEWVCKASMMCHWNCNTRMCNDVIGL